MAVLSVTITFQCRLPLLELKDMLHPQEGDEKELQKFVLILCELMLPVVLQQQHPPGDILLFLERERERDGNQLPIFRLTRTFFLFLYALTDAGWKGQIMISKFICLD